MYKIEWDKETGGIKLLSHYTVDTLGIAPRPVFYEELDLLGLDKLGWDYPRCSEPIMWGINKQYFYKGEHLFNVTGANIYTMPTIEFCPGIKPMVLQPIDIEAMLDKTADLMFVLENEAIEFIRDTFITYTRVNKTYEKAESNQLDFEALAAKAEKKTKQKMAVVKQDCDSFDVIPLDIAKDEGKRVLLSTKTDRFIASFSGGKDSQVVLDLCTRAIPPTDFEVIYSDTGYELPSSLELYWQVQRLYNKRFPSLKFHLASNHDSVLNYWDKIGTPSDTHRWCCSIMKTVPLYKHLKKSGNKEVRFIAFEGVRAEESIKRNDYNRIGKGVKHNFVINTRPILKWNTTEVFLYLFRYSLPINKAYRIGKPRVGCILCPFGSPWDDMIVNKCYHKELDPFLSRLENIVKERNIPNGKEYISDRKWKVRGSGKFSNDQTAMSYVISPNKWEVKVKNAQKSILEWLPVIGKYSLKELNGNIRGELLFQKDVYQFEIKIDTIKTDFTFTLFDNNNSTLRFLLRRIVNKAAYCINCEACELECPTGALTVLPKLKIDSNLCIHCYKCIEHHNQGCIVADSLQKPSETNLIKMKISKYGTFGIHQDWVDQFLTDPDSFWTSNILGVKQVPSFKAWLKDAEIIDEKGRVTPFGELCKKINEDSQKLLWEVIYINLVHNSPLIKWYACEVAFDKDILRKELDKLALDYFQSQFKENTILYAIQALIQTFKYSPIGDSFMQCVPQDYKGTIIRRQAYNDLGPEAIAYSIYKYAQTKEMEILRVSKLYQHEEKAGVYKEFGISRDNLMKALRYLTIQKDRVLVAELTMGLEHITLNKDLTPVMVLNKLMI